MIVVQRRWKLKKAVSLSMVVLLQLAVVVVAEAQQTGKIPRIGFLSVSPLSTVSSRLLALRQGLRELGYTEGKNIVLELRSADGIIDRLPAVAAELINHKVDVIVTGAPAGTRAAKDATVKIPIVMATDSDPVGNGFVASLAQPGGNITGLSTLAPEISGKRLELLKETIPRFSQAAVLGNLSAPTTAQMLRETEAAAGALGVHIQFFDVRGLKDVENAFRAASNGRANGVLALPSSTLNSYRAQVVEYAFKNRLPAIFYAAEWVEDGGLMTYGVSFTDLHRRAATYVDKILKGAKPADIPVEQPMKFEFLINLKAAKQIGVTIPPNVLARADRVIK
jgi:putative tryptophan/tyrosine transport system substrate-binding protein